MALTAWLNRVASNVQVFLRGAAWAPGANPSRASLSLCLVIFWMSLGVSMAMVHIYRDNIKKDASVVHASLDNIKEDDSRDYTATVFLSLEEVIRNLEEIKIILQNEIHEQRSNVKCALGNVRKLVLAGVISVVAVLFGKGNVQVFLRGAAWAPGANPSRASLSLCLVIFWMSLGVSMAMVHIYRDNIKKDASVVHASLDNIEEDDSRGEYHSRTNWAPYDSKFDTAGVRMGHFLKE